MSNKSRLTQVLSSLAILSSVVLPASPISADSPPPIQVGGAWLMTTSPGSCDVKWMASIRNNSSAPIPAGVSVGIQGWKGTSHEGPFTAPIGGKIMTSFPAPQTNATVEMLTPYDPTASYLKFSLDYKGTVFNSWRGPGGSPFMGATPAFTARDASTDTALIVNIVNQSYGVSSSGGKYDRSFPNVTVELFTSTSTTTTPVWLSAGKKTVGCMPFGATYRFAGRRPEGRHQIKVVVTGGQPASAAPLYTVILRSHL